jgi:hypothetical protein
MVQEVDDVWVGW